MAGIQKGLHIGLTLGDDHIGGGNRRLQLLACQFQHRAGDVGAVVDDGEGHSHLPGIVDGGIVLGRAAPDTDGDGKPRELIPDDLQENPIEADLAGIVRQVQQAPSLMKIGTEGLEIVPIHLDGVEHFQHFVQLFKADLPLKGGKIDVIAQNCPLQARIEGICRRTHHGLNPVEAFHHILIAQPLFLGEAVIGKAKIFGEELCDIGGIVGRRHLGGALAEDTHQIPGEGRHLLLTAELSGSIRVPLEQAQNALVVQSHTRTSS